MRTDSQIKQDILDEFVFQPNIEENLIGVVVEDGVVMLTGVVDDFSIKVAAKEAVSKVKGVKAVAEDIEVKYGTAYQKTDIEIAKAIVHAFEWNTAIPENKIKVEVCNGWITLSGDVEFPYEKEAAKRITEQIIGVKGINNAIEIEPTIKPEVIKENIIKALKRSADLEASKIIIKVYGDVVKLEGKVDSLNQKRTAQKTAYYAPGVNKVENELVVMG
ncbi:BON domain-containing protein [Winogradskyella sp. PC D3.3]